VGGRQGGEMAQTMYAHLNKLIKKKKVEKQKLSLEFTSLAISMLLEG
jgi:hypothetical protein